MPGRSAHTPRRRLGLAGAVLRVQPDTRLARLAGEGLEPAFEELVRRYRPALTAYAAAVVGRDRADDVVQEVLFRASSEIASKPEMDPRGWLFRAVRNASLNDRRDNRKHLHAQLDEGMNGVERPDDVLARRQRLATVVAALGALPRSQRDALVQHELEGRSHAEIAGTLAVSVGAVRQLIYRARTTLRDGIGSLVPVPMIRFLIQSPGGAESAGAGIAAAASGAGGAKVVAVVAVAGGTLFAGAALHHGSSEGSGPSPTVAERVGADGTADTSAPGSGRSDGNGGVGGGGSGARGGQIVGQGGSGQAPPAVSTPGDPHQAGGHEPGSPEGDSGGTHEHSPGDDGGSGGSSGSDAGGGSGETQGDDSGSGASGGGDGGVVGDGPGDGPTGGDGGDGGGGGDAPPALH